MHFQCSPRSSWFENLSSGAISPPFEIQEGRRDKVADDIWIFGRGQSLPYHGHKFEANQYIHENDPNHKFGECEDEDDEWTDPCDVRDILFKANYIHIDQNPTCDICASDLASIIPRNLRRTTNPRIHSGNIGSGNSVMKMVS